MVLVDGAAYERAIGERDRAFMFADEMQKEAERLRALAHDLYDELLQESLGQPDPRRRRLVMERYREVSGERDADADHA